MNQKIHIFVTSFLMSLVFLFFTSIFWNPYFNTSKFDADHWFWVNRGLIVPWSGVTALDKIVDFPYIKIPIHAKKIIDLRIFIPTLFIFTIIIFMALTNFLKLFFKKIFNIKYFIYFLFVIDFAFIMQIIFLYLNWFSRL